MGSVFEGLHELIERKVAIKVLHPEFASQPEFTARFFNEARAVNRVAHPGIVQISDFGQLPDSTAYIVMEFLHGESLAKRLMDRNGPLAMERALNLSSQLADALAAAHDKGIIHRDLKPDNVMIVPDTKAPGGERTKLLDFGIAKLVDEGLLEKGPGLVKTSTNSIMGTPYYMSPEQCRAAGKVDGRSDVYSLGVMMYEMLSGVRPITGDGQGDIIVKHITEEPTPLRNRMPELPVAVGALVHRMMVKDREQRPSMQEVTSELDALSEQFPPPSARRSTSNVALIVPPAAPYELLPTGIGTAAGQTAAPTTHRRGRSRSVIVAAAGAVLLFGGISIQALRHRPAAAPPAPVAPQNIHWTIDSTPAGAEVVQLSDNRVLGTTPWACDHPLGSGTLKVKLRLTGYSEKELELSQSTDVSRSETLAELPPAPTPTEPDAASEERGKKGQRGKSARLKSKAAAGAGKGKKPGVIPPKVKSGRQIED